MAIDNTGLTQPINIGGVAIKAGLSRNNIKYTEEELKKFTPTLKNRPILKDHESRTDNTIGVVTKSKFDINTVSYNGWVKEDGSGIIEKINDGRVKEVSIGAIAGKLVKESEDSDVLIAKDIIAMELSTTPTPGVVGTSISQTLEDIQTNETAKRKIPVRPILENMDSFKSIIEKVTENKETEEDMIDKIADKVVEKLHNTIENQVTAENKNNNISTHSENLDEKKKENDIKEDFKMTEEQIKKTVPEEVKTEEKSVKDTPVELVKEEVKVDNSKELLSEKDIEIEKLKEEIRMKQVEEKDAEIAALKEKLIVKEEEKEEEEKEEVKKIENKTVGRIPTSVKEEPKENKELAGYAYENFGRSYSFFKENYNDSKLKNLNPRKDFYEELK